MKRMRRKQEAVQEMTHLEPTSFSVGHLPTFIEKGPWILRCAPGLARVLSSEMVFRGFVHRQTSHSFLRQRNHDLIFVQHTHRVPSWNLLRIPDEVHRCIVYGRYKISNAQLERLAAVLKRIRRPLRVIVTADGSHFSRQEMKRYLSRELQRLKVPISEDADALLYTFCIDEAYYICLPYCSARDAPLRVKRASERQGALPVTIAAAVAFLGKPKAEDVIIDPLCGSGTILAEANAYASGATLIGIDIDPNALESASRNLSHIKNCKLITADSTRTGLSASIATLVLANLPFGKQFGSKAKNPHLYKALLAEMHRIGVPGKWRAVLLTSDVAAMEAALAQSSHLRLDKRVSVVVRGEKATIFLVSSSAEFGH
jgi:predicted RNA methylase